MKRLIAYTQLNELEEKGWENKSGSGNLNQIKIDMSLYNDDLIDYNDNIYIMASSDIIKQIKDEIPYINRKVIDIDWSKQYNYQGDINEINLGFNNDKNIIFINPTYTYVGEKPTNEAINGLNKLLNDYFNDFINKLSYNKVDKAEFKKSAKKIFKRKANRIDDLYKKEQKLIELTSKEDIYDEITKILSTAELNELLDDCIKNFGLEDDFEDLN